MVKIAPSVLALDYSRFSEQLALCNDNAEWLHYDVMDGHFVPNLSFGPDILKQFRANCDLFLDVHLMVAEPLFFAPRFIESGAQMITFHQEVHEEAYHFELINYLHENDIKAGMSIKPNTPVSTLKPYLDRLDLVLVMSVEPGFGGQAFIESSYEKIKELKALREKGNHHYLIEVDGGVSDKNAKQLAAAGCDVLVAGSYIFKGDIKERIASLRS